MIKLRKMVGKCPVCDNNRLEITKLRCSECGTSIEGRFSTSKLGGLSTEHQEFIEIFVKSRGSIKDVEKELGVSYPTVRGKLDNVIKALGYTVEETGGRRKEILEAIEKKEMSPDEAVKALKDMGQDD